MNVQTFLRIVQEEAGLANREQAKKATQLVFDLLHHRITEDEAEDVKSQLPKDLAEMWDGGDNLLDRLISRFTPHHKFERMAFVEAVNDQKGTLPSTGEKITRAVFYALQSQISPGEAKDVAQQLPKQLRELWEESRPLAKTTGGSGGAMDDITGIEGTRTDGGFGDIV